MKLVRTIATLTLLGALTACGGEDAGPDGDGTAGADGMNGWLATHHPAMLAAAVLPAGTFPDGGFTGSPEALAEQAKGCDQVDEQRTALIDGVQALPPDAPQGTTATVTEYVALLTGVLDQVATDCRWNLEHNTRAGRDEPLREQGKELEALQTERDGELAWLRAEDCTRTSWGDFCTVLADVFDHTNQARIDLQQGTGSVAAVKAADEEWFGRLADSFRQRFPERAKDPRMQRDWRSSDRFFTLAAQDALSDVREVRDDFAALAPQ